MTTDFDPFDLYCASIARRVFRPGDDPITHLLRTTYILLVRNRAAREARIAVVSNVFFAAGNACGTSWPRASDGLWITDGWQATHDAFVAVLDKICAMRLKRRNHSGGLDETYIMTRRSRLHRLNPLHKLRTRRD